MKIEKSRRIVESRPVCMDLNALNLQNHTRYEEYR